MNGHNSRIGDDQRVGGLPKHMHARAGAAPEDAEQDGEMKTYWRFHPKPQACDKCRAVDGLWFEERPDPVHPNCNCEIEEFQAIKVTGRADAIIVPPGVDIEANLAEARRIRGICEGYVYRAPMPINPASFFLKCYWTYINFANGKRYDYKQRGEQFEDFGNYHYGLYTKALGLNATFAQIAAGAAQWKSGTSKGMEYWRAWFDDPRDNEMIQRGQSKIRF